MCLFMRYSCLCDLAIIFIVIFEQLVKERLREKGTHWVYNRPFFNLAFYQHFKRCSRCIPIEIDSDRIYLSIEFNESTGISHRFLFKLLFLNRTESVNVISNLIIYLVYMLRLFYNHFTSNNPYVICIVFFQFVL